MGDLDDMKGLLMQTIEFMKVQAQQNTLLVEKLLQENQELRTELNSLKNKVESPQKKNTLYTEIERKYKRKRKDIIMHKILTLISDRDYSLPEMKDKIVDEFNYCSKATFYRYIEEIKDKGFIAIADNRIISTATLQ
jgi:hypothetical protein